MALRKIPLREWKDNLHTWRKFYKPYPWKMIINQLHKNSQHANTHKKSFLNLSKGLKKSFTSRQIPAQREAPKCHPASFTTRETMAIIPSDEQAQMRVPNGGEDAERRDDTDDGWDMAGSTLKHSLTVSMKTEDDIATRSPDHQPVPCSGLAPIFTRACAWTSTADSLAVSESWRTWVKATTVCCAHAVGYSARKVDSGLPGLQEFLGHCGQTKRPVSKRYKRTVILNTEHSI